MRKFILFLLLIMLYLPLINQNKDSEKKISKFGDVFERRDDDETYPDISEMVMYKEKNELKPMKKKEKIIWAYKTAKENPFM